MSDEAQPQRPEFSPREREGIAMTVIGSILARKAAGQTVQVNEISTEVQTAKAIWRKLEELLPDPNSERERRRLDDLRDAQLQYDHMVEDMLVLLLKVTEASGIDPELVARTKTAVQNTRDVRQKIARLR